MPIGKLWGSRVPGWALCLTAKGYHALMAIIGAELEDRGLSFDFGDGVVAFEHGGRRVEWDLRPLAGRCCDAEREEWNALVAADLEEALAGRRREA